MEIGVKSGESQTRLVPGKAKAWAAGLCRPPARPAPPWDIGRDLPKMERFCRKKGAGH